MIAEEWEPFGASVDLCAFPMDSNLDAAIDVAMALDKS